jgi:hypothetical protein
MFEVAALVAHSCIIFLVSTVSSSKANVFVLDLPTLQCGWYCVLVYSCFQASIPTFSLLLGVLSGVETFDAKLLLCVLGIGAGVVIASIGEVEFVPIG